MCLLLSFYTNFKKNKFSNILYIFYYFIVKTTKKSDFRFTITQTYSPFHFSKGIAQTNLISNNPKHCSKKYIYLLQIINTIVYDLINN